MADGSVVIGVSLDTSSFAAQAASLEAQITQLGGRINASLSQSFAGDGLAASLNGALMSVYTTLNNMAAALTVSMSEAASSAIAGFTGAGWSEAGSSAIGETAAGIVSGSSAVTSAAGTAAREAESAFASGGWYGIGQSMMDGIAAGILSSAASVTSAMQKVSAEAERAAKDYYRIASPSRLMHDEVGVMIARGIAEGILDGASFVSGAMSAVYGDTPVQVLGGGSGGFGGAAGLSGGKSVTQNIYLRDSDESPYRTAKRIRRESEAIFR